MMIIISCPACSTPFRVDEHKFGRQGRNVRCGSCRHVWFESGPEAVTPVINRAAPESRVAAPQSQPANPTSTEKCGAVVPIAVDAQAAAQADDPEPMTPVEIERAMLVKQMLAQKIPTSSEPAPSEAKHETSMNAVQRRLRGL